MVEIVGQSQEVFEKQAGIAQLAEHFLGKEEVLGSSPSVGSIFKRLGLGIS
jgi:hypothetical protein